MIECTYWEVYQQGMKDLNTTHCHKGSVYLRSGITRAFQVNVGLNPNGQ